VHGRRAGWLRQNVALSPTMEARKLIRPIDCDRSSACDVIAAGQSNERISQ
jgi:hypothetical protein